MYYYSFCCWKFGPGVEFVLYFGMEEYGRVHSFKSEKHGRVKRAQTDMYTKQ